MPAPNPRSKMVHRLVRSTGLTAVWVYRLLAQGREPADRTLARKWRRIVTSVQARQRVAQDAGAVACPQPTTAGAA